MPETLKNGNPRPLIISGYSSRTLGQEIADALGSKHIDVHNKQHPNSEIELLIDPDENLRGHDVVVVASAAGEPNKQEKETRLLMRAARRGSARKVTLVLPYDTYGRSDAAKHGGIPGFIDTVDTYRPLCNNAIGIDPHNPKLFREKFNDGDDGKCTIVDFAFPYAIQIRSMIQDGYFASKNNVVLGFADEGGTKRATDEFRICMYDILGFPERDPYINDWPHGSKGRHGKTNKAQMLSFIGDVAGKDIIIFEDMAASSGTMCLAADFLKDAKANSVTFFASKGLFTADKKAGERDVAAVERLNQSRVDAVFITNVFDHREVSPQIHAAIERSPVIHEINVSNFIASIVSAIHMEVHDYTSTKQNSVSALLSGRHPDQKGEDQIIAKAIPLKPNSPLAIAKNKRLETPEYG